MDLKKKNLVKKNWKKYLPSKYIKVFPIRKKTIVHRTVMSKRHQTHEYQVEGFYKMISKFR